MSNPATLRDKFQIAAFTAHWKIAKRAGDNHLTAFVKGICQTSDDRTREALEARPDAIEQWARLNGYYKKYFE